MLWKVTLRKFVDGWQYAKPIRCKAATQDEAVALAKFTKGGKGWELWLIESDGNGE